MDNLKLTSPGGGHKYNSSSSDNAADGWLRSNPKIESVIFNDGGYFSPVDLLVWMIPIVTITILLTIILKYDLLVISGLLFCWLLYDLTKQKLPETFRLENKKIFTLAITITLVSKILYFLKDVYIRHESLGHTVLNPVDLYKICFLSVSYQSFGFIKRGLIPTIVSFLSGNYFLQLYMVQMIGFVIFIVGLLLLAKQKGFSITQKRFFIPVLLLSPIGIYYHFTFTLGFYDMALIGLLFISIAFKNSAGSIIADIIGLMVHEAYIFLSLPFHFFNLVSLIQQKKSFRFELFAIAANILVLLFVITLPKPGFEDLKNNYFNHYGALRGMTNAKDLEAFLPLSREGTLGYDFHAMIKFFHTDKSLSFVFPIMLSILNVGFLSYFTNNISGKLRAVDLLCAITAFIFPLILCLIGADFGRWMNFAYTSWIIYYILFRPNLFPSTEISVSCLYGVLLAALIFLPFGFNYNPLFYFLFGR
ncbi:MAG: hypothetical protein JST75_10675 [Bacteroidetes bacterium]|nr:hypothetical protein [Bacteroidota bacterium]